MLDLGKRPAFFKTKVMNLGRNITGIGKIILVKPVYMNAFLAIYNLIYQKISYILKIYIIILGILFLKK